MKCTLPTLQTLKVNSRKTFGEVLNQPNSLKHTKLKPPGYDILETKFKSQIGDLRKYLQHESQDKNNKFESKDDVINLIDKYVTQGVNGSGQQGNSRRKSSVTDKKLGIIQRKMIMAAYAKAGKKMGGNVKEAKGSDKIQADRVKLAVLMKRNWPLLEFVAKESGVEISKQDDNESWGFEEELEKSESTELQKKDHKENNGISLGRRPDIRSGNTDFNSFLKKLNKVHQTAAIHVLPEMTAFEAHPTISHIHSHVEIPDSEVKGFQDFLQNAKQVSENRDDLLFKAKTNYEWSKNLLSREPRTLENNNFFTPICVPKTLIPVHEYGLKKIIEAQGELKKSLPKLELEKLDVLKIYADGSSGVLRNDNLTYWHGDIENLYTIISQLQHPENFKSNLLKYVRLNWVPVNSEEKEIVFVRDNWKHRLDIARKGAVVGIVGVCVTLGIAGIITGL